MRLAGLVLVRKLLDDKSVEPFTAFVAELEEAVLLVKRKDVLLLVAFGGKRENCGIPSITIGRGGTKV
jgi:hypothetical protein